ncbi:MAG: thioredoxin family protein [Thermoguttaceae bacterium]|jgi:thioredoxin-like negative regulator of GroEL
MSGVILMALWTAALGATESDNYTEAHQQMEKTGRPMLVMVSTDWCAPCQVMKKTVIPQVRQRGLLGRVAFAVVNPDRDRDLANRLTGGGPVPQLVLFRKTPRGWTRRQLVGRQSVEEVENFINQGLVADGDGKDSAAKPEASQKTAGAKKGPTA